MPHQSFFVVHEQGLYCSFQSCLQNSIRSEYLDESNILCSYSIGLVSFTEAVFIV